MPGKKRKAAAAAAGGTTTKMWGSSSPSSAGNNASSSRRKAPSNRRGGGAKSSAVAVSSSGGSDSKAEKMFEEICDEDNPDAAGMEGKRMNFGFLVLVGWMIFEAQNTQNIIPPLLTYFYKYHI